MANAEADASRSGAVRLRFGHFLAATPNANACAPGHGGYTANGSVAGRF